MKMDKDIKFLSGGMRKNELKSSIQEEIFR